MATIKEPGSAGQPSNERPEGSRHPGTQVGETPTLSVSREKVCHIVFKVREFDVKDLPTFLDEAQIPQMRTNAQSSKIVPTTRSRASSPRSSA
jgi:hypothetical protein